MQHQIISRAEAALEFIDSTYMISLTQMRAMPYKEYLKTAHWQHFRSEALKFYQGKCQLCSSKDRQLEVHHRNYDNVGCETFNDVIVLCEDCHGKFHNKKEG
jgi:5-methylcytosine-specific restriction endonuclease McrA